MRKIIAAINMTLDGIFDHTAVSPGEEIHEHYRNLLVEADAILYGRKTFELMKFWQTLLLNPSGEKSMDDFAIAIDKIPKVVFSNSLTESGTNAVGWESAALSHKSLEETVLEYKKHSGKDIFIGSRSLILQLMKLNLIDELQICIHPVIAGEGSKLFENLNDRLMLRLLRTKTFREGAVVLYYEPVHHSS